MKALDLIDALQKKLDTNSQAALADALGVSVQTLHNWKNRDEDLSPLQVASALAKARNSAIRASQLATIRPIVEFHEIECSPSKHETGWLILSMGDDSTLYTRGLKEKLDDHHGIYIFYDSRGRALYVGKARLQSLWKEMNLAFNRERAVQKIMLVGHPDRNQEFRTGFEKLRQPKDTQLQLCDLASYFSAYAVDDGMIEDLEALMMRGFANDLLNTKMEKFANAKG